MRSPRYGAGAKTDRFSSFELRTHHSVALDVWSLTGTRGSGFGRAGSPLHAALQFTNGAHGVTRPTGPQLHKIFTDKQIRRAPDCRATRLWDIDFS